MRDEEANLLQEFLAHRLSAAGVSYVVTAKSTFRRVVWLVAILITLCGMSFMTYKVVLEYLNYPTVLNTKNIRRTSLEFPAVTVCGQNLIPSIHMQEAGLSYLDEIAKSMEALPRYRISEDERKSCRKSPLCYWSWFEEKCTCSDTPCETEFCFPRSDDNCTCSMFVCKFKGKDVKNGCSVSKNPNYGYPECICKTKFLYSNYSKGVVQQAPRFHGPPPAPSSDNCPPPPQNGERQRDPPVMGDPHHNVNGKNHHNCKPPHRRGEDVNFSAALKELNNSAEVKEILDSIRYSVLYDLRDVERKYLPSLKDVADYGIPFDSLVVSCSFDNDVCDKRNFTTLFSPTFGKCYMFNYVGENNVEGPRMTKHAGQKKGLSLFLKSSQDDVIDILTRQFGARIVIHNPYELPHASENGFNIRPGDMANVRIKYKEIHRLGYPYGECLDDGSHLPFNYKDQPYTQLGCERRCYNHHVFTKCGCHHRMFLSGSVRFDRKQKICNSSETSDDDRCFRHRVLRDVAEEKVNCSCYPSCNEKLYEKFVSAGQANYDFFRLVKTIKSLTMKNGNPSVAEYSKLDIMGLQVFYKDLVHVNVSETPTFSWECLVANIGGNMGLFLGISLITFLEVLEFFTDIVCSLIGRPRRQSVQRVRVQDVIKY